MLDIGCGAGDNAVLIKTLLPHCRISGITLSKDEREQAAPYMDECIVADIEAGVPETLRNATFDVMLFSHVLEHLRHPAEVLHSFSQILRPGGVALLAVPNVLTWQQRWQFVTGRFEYTETGIMDRTHLRFFTYSTADKHLLSKSCDLDLTSKTVTGSVPLWLARRHIFPVRVSALFDSLGCRLAPNLFGSQIILVVRKRLASAAQQLTPDALA